MSYAKLLDGGYVRKRLMLFPRLSEGLVDASLRALQDTMRDKRKLLFEELDLYYYGGPDIVYKIEPKPAETADELSRRKRAVEYANYVRRLSREVIQGLYGDEVKRDIDATFPEATHQKLQDIWDQNRMITTQWNIGRDLYVLGDGWANIAFNQWTENVSVYAVYPGNIEYSTDPNDPNHLIEVVETRTSGKSRVPRSGDLFTLWVWQDEIFDHLTSDGRHIPDAKGQSGPWPNPYGRIPYVKWTGESSTGSTEGHSYVLDAVTIQRTILNRLSDMNTLIEDQAHGLLVLSGNEQPSVESGPKRFLAVGPEGDAKFISPGAELAAVEASIMASIERMYETNSVPISMLRGGSANSGLQLAIEMRPYTRVVESLRASALQSERELVKMVCKIGAVHGLGLPDDVTPVIEFSSNILPSDKNAEFTMDLAMVNNIPPLMTREHFIEKWIDRVRDMESLSAYIAALDAQDMISQSESGRVSGGAAPLPPAPPPTYPPSGGGGKDVTMLPGGGEEGP